MTLPAPVEVWWLWFNQNWREAMIYVYLAWCLVELVRLILSREAPAAWRVSPRKGARVLSAVAVIVSTVGMLAYMIKALGLFASMFLPLSPETCALIMIGAATLYTIASGFYGVIFTDLFQSVIVVSSAVLVAVLASVKVAALGDVAALAYSVTGDPHWTTSALPWETAMLAFSVPTRGSSSAKSWLTSGTASPGMRYAA